MPVVVDASVALKWVLEETGSSAARDVAASQVMIAPDLLLIESANVLTMRVRRGLLVAEDAALALDILQSFPVRLMPTRPRVGRALALSIELAQSTYDCLYLALALEQGARLITADERFSAALKSRPAYSERVDLIGVSPAP
ncbi:MAG: type II toxin-antitoxin system VapC family toxin [Caulobacteraceae bacterium]